MRTIKISCNLSFDYNWCISIQLTETVELDQIIDL